MMVKNQVRSIKVDFPINKVKQAINYVAKVNPNFTNGEFLDSVNSYKFFYRDGIGRIYGGNTYDVTLTSVDNNSTTIEIEGGRLIGAINTSGELQVVKQGIDDLVKVFSLLLPLDNLELASKEIAKQFKPNRSLFSYIGIGLKWILIAFFAYFVLAMAYYVVLELLGIA